MFYSKEKKEFLGRYFKYYREKQGIEFKDVVKTGICDYKTLKGIESGQAKPSNIFYDKLLDYYHLDATMFDILDEINPLIDELYDACEWYDEKRINEVIKFINYQVKTHCNKSIIIDLLNTLEMIENLYISNVYLNEEQIHQALKMINLWNNKLSSLLYEVCEKSNTNYILSNRLFELMSKSNKRDDLIFIYWFARLKVINLNYLEAIEQYNFLLKIYDLKKNYLRKIQILSRLFNIYRDIDVLKAKEIANLLELELENKKIPHNLKSSINYNLGIYYYINNDNITALKRFEESFKYDGSIMTLIFIYACKSRLKILDKIILNMDEKHTYYPILKYFIMKNENTNEVRLENYVLNELMQILMKENYEYPFWNMFDYEMSLLVKKTRNYKKYHLFKENFQKATKTAL